MILPSLLEYSVQSLEKKLEIVHSKIDNYHKKTKNRDTEFIPFHLDFVLPNFAKDRSVMTSIGLSSTLEGLSQRFENRQLDLSIHLMGDTADLYESFEFLDKYEFNQNWKYLLLVPEKFYPTWLNSNFSKNNKNVKNGVWYDLDEWSNKDFEVAENFLLMTVIAGKSGQKLTEENAEKALKIANSNPSKNFIVDGGWSVDREEIPDNCSVVSYSSFWKVFG